MKGMALLMSPKGNQRVAGNPIPWDSEPSLGAAQGCAPSEGLKFGFIGMGVPHAGEEMHTHIPGSWVLPLERKKQQV